MARGDYIATWDDDDWYHPYRLEAQIRVALETGSEVCWLEDALHYFEDSGELFVVRWSGGLPPSLLCWRTSMLPYTERLAPDKGERAIEPLLQRQLHDQRSMSRFSGSPFLYGYQCPGDNVRHRSHIIERAFGTTPEDVDLSRLTPGLRERVTEDYPVEAAR